MSWNVIVTDDPAVKPRSSRDVIISSQESADVDRLVSIVTTHLQGLRQNPDVFLSVLYTSTLRELGYKLGPRAWMLYHIAASRITDPGFKVESATFDYTSSKPEDRYFLITKHKLPAGIRI